MLPAAALFKQQGANRGALASFLVSTPETGVDSIAITYALLDPIMTVMRPISAFISGTAAGLLENSLTYPKKTTPNQLRVLPMPLEDGQSRAQANDRRSIVTKLIASVKYGVNDVWGDIVIWFFGGLLLAGIITVVVPEHLSSAILGGGLVSMLAMLVIGLPVYLCATASTPIAAALLIKGASPGAVLVFLLVGPATNMTSLSVLISILGKMGTLRYLLVIATVSVLLGLGLDELYRLWAIEPKAVLGEAQELVPNGVKLGATLVLLSISVPPIVRWLRLRTRKPQRVWYFSNYPAPQAPIPDHKNTEPLQRRGSAQSDL